MAKSFQLNLDSEWYKLKDDDVLMHWVCPIDPSDEAWVSPDFYETNGTPISAEGSDMEYKGTYIKDL